MRVSEVADADLDVPVHCGKGSLRKCRARSVASPPSEDVSSLRTKARHRRTVRGPTHIVVVVERPTPATSPTPPLIRHSAPGVFRWQEAVFPVGAVAAKSGSAGHDREGRPRPGTRCQGGSLCA